MKRRPSTNNNGFKLMQTKVGQLIQQDHSGIDPLLKSYYQTLTALRYNQAPQALTYSQKLPNLPQTQVTQAQVLNANQRYAETTKRFMGYIRGGSTSPLLIPVAQALVAQNQSTRAWQLINSARLAETTSLELLDYKQQLAKQLGYSSEALLASAERAVRLGNYAQAKMSLEQGLRSNPAPATRPVLTQRLADIKQAETIKKQLDKF
jgi:predicted Zn-dependent protease